MVVHMRERSDQLLTVSTVFLSICVWQSDSMWSPPESPGAVGMGGDGWAWSGAGAAGLPLQGWEIWGFHATGEKTGRSASGSKQETTGEFRN